MEKIEWILTLGMDTIKISMLLFGILGFETNKGKRKYVSFLYLLLGIPAMLVFSGEPFWYVWLWKVLFISVFVQATIGKKIQCFLLQMIAVTLVDLAVWGMCINIIPYNSEDNMVSQKVCEAIAVVIWLVVILLLNPYKKKIQKYIKNLSAGYITVMIMELFCMMIIVSCIYGIICNKMTEKIQRKALIFCVIAVLLNIVFCFLFSHMSYSKKQIKLQNDMAQRQMELQKKYYDKIMQQDEGIRKFRHDIKSILKGLEILKNSDDIEGLKKYIDDVCGIYKENITLQIGNAITDYFINDTLDEIHKFGDLDFKIEGKFPDTIKMKDSDWCILIANAMDNAKEALLRVENDRKLFIEVKQMNEGLWFCINNSAVEKQKRLLETTKKDKKNHGYGTENMKCVVEKYGGKIEFDFRQGMFWVEVYLI